MQDQYRKQIANLLQSLQDQLQECQALEEQLAAKRKEMESIVVSLAQYLQVPLYQEKSILPASIRQLEERQLQIALLICQGKTNKEIADQLGTTVVTIKNQVKLILARLGLKSRYEIKKLL